MRRHSSIDVYKRQGYDRWFEQDLNNAKLAGHSTYHHWTPAFIALFEQEGQNFTAFYRAAEVLGRLPPREREARLRELLELRSIAAMNVKDARKW